MTEPKYCYDCGKEIEGDVQIAVRGPHQLQEYVHGDDEECDA